jgi:hypothetical protein
MSLGEGLLELNAVFKHRAREGFGPDNVVVDLECALFVQITGLGVEMDIYFYIFDFTLLLLQ